MQIKNEIEIEIKIEVTGEVEGESSQFGLYPNSPLLPEQRKTGVTSRRIENGGLSIEN